LPGATDGTGTAARFNYPLGFVLDSSGNLYVADTSNHTIRKVTSVGVVTTLAGAASTPGSADGTGSSARFYGPEGVALDGTDTLYIADTVNHTIRKIVLSTAAITTVAGQVGIAGSADGTGAAATFNAPSGVTVGASGTLYVTDSENNTIRKIAADGAVTTLVGLAGSSGAADGTGSAARFSNPSALAADSSGANLYVLDTDNHTVRKVVIATSAVTSLAGSAGTLGSADGLGDTVRFNFPTGIAWTSMGLGIADTANHTLRFGLFSAAVAITAQPQSQTVTAGNNATSVSRPRVSRRRPTNGISTARRFRALRAALTRSPARRRTTAATTLSPSATCSVALPATR